MYRLQIFADTYMFFKTLTLVILFAIILLFPYLKKELILNKSNLFCLMD